jgi:hypothetical protein
MTSTESKPKALSVGRKHSILGKTFRINRIKLISCNDITKPVNVRHTAHVGASGHNFGDLSFLEPGGRCSKTNGLECGVDYDSPVLAKVKDIDVRSCTSSKSGGDESSWGGHGKGHHGKGSRGLSSASDSGHGSSTDPDVSDISSEISSRDVKNDLTEDDISDLTSLDQSINKRGRRRSSSLSGDSSVGESDKPETDYFEFSVDMGPSLLDDVMGTIEKLEIKRTSKKQKAIKI